MIKNRLIELTDNDLILMLKQGDKEAFNEIYNRYENDLRDAAFRQLHSADDAKDVVQEVFISLFIRYDKLQITHSLEAYLFTAIKYKSLNHIRSNRIRKKHINRLSASSSSTETTPAKILYLKELNQQIRYIIASLPKKCRQVYLLSRKEGFTYRDIANELGISISTVEKHIIKALRIIRSRLQTYQVA
ncbi:MAG TPA: RNA polymerase sigma-70 factor [Chitinophagaceae bacterium]|nr:RNA polymerase sigma-70 factor [Chitinophagaceae bacterium]